MLFYNILLVKQFDGDDFEQSYVSEKAMAMLSRIDKKSQHDEIINEINY